LPKLAGRAKVKLSIHSNNGIYIPEKYSISSLIINNNDDVKKILKKDVDIVLVVDGYHTPVSSGNFINLVRNHYYDNIYIDNVEQLFVQFGKYHANTDDKGSVVPTSATSTTNNAKIPLELFYKNDEEPTYEITSDDDLRATETMILPFQALGAVGIARENDDVSSNNNEIFFLKWTQALIPPGRNTLDGYYTSIGYITENENILSQIKKGDIIVKAEVTEGGENLMMPMEGGK
jgi:peptidylprolyl isomerase